MSYCNLALTLLVPGVFADDHHPAVTTNDLAFVADFLDGGVDLHEFYLFSLSSYLTWGNPWQGRY